MTRDEIRKRFQAVQNLYKPEKDEMPIGLEEKQPEESERVWTEEDILAAAKRIAKRLGITEPFYSGEE